MNVALEIVEKPYPNGNVYGVFRIDGREVGRANSEAGGWMPWGTRKVLSADDAARKMIGKKIADAKRTLRDMERLRSLLTEDQNGGGG